MKALVLRVCDAKLRSYGGFQWPSSGSVEASDWDPTPECGRGLHGWLFGEGDLGVAQGVSDEDSVWLVVEVEKDTLVDIGGKVKFPRGEVVFAGPRDEAITYIVERAPGHATHFARVTAGDFGTATAGYGGTATAGCRGTATAGDEGTATAGVGGTATAGTGGTATAGHGGTATAGVGGTATAGDGGTAIAGYGGTATAGYGGTATAGESGRIEILHWDGRRYRKAIGYVGEAGIEPNVAYRLVDGRFVRK